MMAGSTTFKRCLACEGTSEKERRESECWLPWEFGSGKVSLATKCITVVFPKGSLRAGETQADREGL